MAGTGRGAALDSRAASRTVPHSAFEHVVVRGPLACPNPPEGISIAAERDAYQRTLYRAEARDALDLAAPEQENGLFAVAGDGDGTASACGAGVLGRARASFVPVVASLVGHVLASAGSHWYIDVVTTQKALP
jgi:hypothetical protein